MVKDNTHRRNPRKLGIVLIIVLSTSLFPTQQLVFAHHDIFATHDRIQKAFGDIQKEYSGAGIQCGRGEKGFYIQNDEGCGTTSKLKDESWAEFGFASLSIDTEGDVAAHQQEFTFLSSLYTDSNSPYYMSALVRDHNGVITSTVEGDKIHTRIWWGNLSLFSVFWGESTISGFNSLAKDQKTERILKIHNTAIKYAQKLEDKLLKYQAYDIPRVIEEPKEHLPIIFLPGVAGTFLWSGNVPVWPVPPTNGELEYILLKEDGRTEKNTGSKITVGDIMRSSTISKLDFYGGMIKFLVSKNYKEGKDLLTFPYDWRIDNNTQLAELDQKVDDLRKKNDGKKVILIAHSMGGLISRAYVNTIGASKVDTLITIGTPFYGSPKPYYALTEGYDFSAPVDAKLMKWIAQNAPAVYQLLPRVPFITDSKTGQKISLKDSYDISYKGVEKKDGKYIDTSNNIWNFNLGLRELADQFHANLGTKDKPKPLPSGVKHYVIIGYGDATVSGFGMRDVNTGESFVELLGRHVVLIPIIRDGDGTVPVWSAQIDGATRTYYIPYLNEEHSSAHGDLAKNPSVQKLVGDIIDKKPPPSESYPGKGTSLQILEDLTVFIIHSDAHLSIVDESTGGRLGLNNQGVIDETIGSGTFLSIEGVEYAMIADTSKTYKVAVNGITDGKFTLSVDITRSGETTAKFSYPEVPVKKGTIAQFNINPNKLAPNSPPPAIEVSTNGKITTIPAKVEVLTTPPPPSQTQPSETGKEILEKGGEVVEKGGEALQKAGEALQKGGGGGCLIATAAFGSELTPQVQFLRNFRDNHILSTIAGSSFMNVFNAWYYSFSPYVANYEREQLWLQQTVKTAIYPLLGILFASEKAYSSIDGEYGSLAAGLIASSMIGALYFWPFAISVRRVRAGKFNYRLAIYVIASVSAAVVLSLVIGNQLALMASTSLFVLSLIAVSAILSAKLIMATAKRLWRES